MNQLALTFHVKFYGFPVRTAHTFPELSPILNSLPVDSADNVALLESGAIRWSSGSDLVEDRRERRITHKRFLRRARGQRPFPHWLETPALHLHILFVPPGRFFLKLFAP